MTVYADTPRWGRHGLLWGHLVSDTSLEELHRTAAVAGLHSRSFDLDHYDWPETARPALLAARVRMVGNKELTRRLIAGGLRIPASRRPEVRRERTRRAALALGLEHIPRDLITGELGHVDPLPAEAGAYRLTRDSADAPPRIEAGDEAGRRAAKEMLRGLDAASRRATGAPWIGQVMDAPHRA